MFSGDCCFWCNTPIDKKGNFIIVKCNDYDDCGNYDYFCSDLCIDEIRFNITLDFTKCYCCEDKTTKVYNKKK